jgi:hypothetical protein
MTPRADPLILFEEEAARRQPLFTANAASGLEQDHNDEVSCLFRTMGLQNMSTRRRLAAF